MKRTPFVWISAGILFASTLPNAGVRASGADASQTAIDARVEALLGQMTLEEKAGQLNQHSTGSVTGPGQPKTDDDPVKKGMVGSLLNSVTAADTNTYQKETIDGSRLHIPLLFGLDVIHGFRTIFPIPLGLSASWDTDLIEQTARRAAVEASSQGVRWTFSPMVDIARDARWGRISEGAGEDPYLGSAIARAYVRGYQGKGYGDPTSIVACAKHFVGYGAAEGGREYNTTEISEGTLRNIYLPPFKAAVDEGAGTLMSAFNALNGVPASANAFTLNQVLRNEWGFQGFVVSDWTAIREVMVHGLAEDEATAARKSFNAGVDMDMESNFYVSDLPDLVRKGLVSQARLDDAVRRILRIKLALGLFEHPYVTEAPEAPLDLALARKAAGRSFVLLENRGVGGHPLLPLTAAAGKRIALIGPLADSAADMLGPWDCQGNPADVVTLRQSLALRSKISDIVFTYEKGTDISGLSEAGFAPALKAAADADVVVMALGESSHSSGEAGARSRLNLQGNQEKLLDAVVATGKPVVFILFSGRPLAVTWAAEHVTAFMMAWFPGVEAGPALVRTLFGDSDPVGRLTVSVPRATGQEPIYYNVLSTGRPADDPIAMAGVKVDPYYHTGYIDERNTPLYPFGAGLSYTSFSYSEPSVSTASLSAGALNEGKASVTVGADITNTGSRAGTEVAQFYIRLRGTSVARPIRELKGFRRLALAPGETKRVEFTLGRDELSFWNLDMKDVAEPSALYVWVSPDSTQGTPKKITISD